VGEERTLWLETCDAVLRLIENSRGRRELERSVVFAGNDDRSTVRSHGG
jgi:hypothetical protein